MKKRRFERKRVITPGAADGRVIASQQKSTDINQIISHYKKTGQLTHIAKSLPTYGDFSNVGDYHDALNQIHSAERSFMEIPSGIRERFGNDPGKFLAFVDDPANQDELIEMGLAPDPRIPAPPVTDPVTEPEVPSE